MSKWRDPAGSKDKNVYVRRRVLVLLGFIALVAAVVLVIIRPGSNGGVGEMNTVELPGDLAQVAQQQTTQDPATVQACAPGQLTVTPVVSSQNVAPEETPQLSLTVENTGQAECTADLGTAGMTFSITSGSDQVWRSTDCQKNPDHRAVILKPGTPLPTTPIPWDRTRSGAETCGAEREPMPGGGASYHLTASVGGVSSVGTAQFQLY